MKKNKNAADRLICNRCGKKQRIERGIPVEEFLKVTKSWGYFSRKDGQTDTFCLCEDCYDQMTAAFVRRPETRQETESFPALFAEESID